MHCEVVEQLGVTGRLSCDTEVFGGTDKTVSDQMLPDSINHNSRRQRILIAADESSQLKPATFGAGNCHGGGAQDLGKPPFDGLCGLVNFTSYQQSGIC